MSERNFLKHWIWTAWLIYFIQRQGFILTGSKRPCWFAFSEIPVCGRGTWWPQSCVSTWNASCAFCQECPSLSERTLVPRHFYPQKVPVVSWIPRGPGSQNKVLTPLLEQGTVSSAVTAHGLKKNPAVHLSFNYLSSPFVTLKWILSLIRIPPERLSNTSKSFLMKRKLASAWNLCQPMESN